LSLSALDFFLEVDEEEKYNRIDLRRFRCYQDMAVIAYWRPFSRSPGIPPLDFQFLEIVPSERQLEIHAILKKYRDKVVAHSDVELMRIALHSIEVGEGIKIPHVIWDEGLDLLDIRYEWVAWLHLLTSKIIRRLFAEVEGIPSGSSIRQDYLNPD